MQISRCSASLLDGTMTAVSHTDEDTCYMDLQEQGRPRSLSLWLVIYA